MKTRVLLDTGPLVAFLNRRDRHHAWSVEQLRDVHPPLLTCESVLSEASFLLRSGPRGGAPVMELLERGLLELPLDARAEAGRVAELMTRYASVPMSLADAWMVRLAELNRESTVLTLDHDFRVYRKNGRQVIPTILPPS